MNILDIAPFGVNPPLSGGHKRIHNLNLEASKKDHNIFLFSQGIRAHELKFPLKNWTSTINDKYIEYRYVNIVSILASVITNHIGSPIFSGNMLGLFKQTILEKQIEQNEIIKIEHPWQFKYIYKLNTKYKHPIILVEHNAEFELINQNTKVSLMSKRLKKIAIQKEKYALENADYIFTTSDEDKNKLIEEFNISEKNFI